MKKERNEILREKIKDFLGWNGEINEERILYAQLTKARKAICGKAICGKAIFTFAKITPNSVDTLRIAATVVKPSSALIYIYIKINLRIETNESQRTALYMLFLYEANDCRIAVATVRSAG